MNSKLDLRAVEARLKLPLSNAVTVVDAWHDARTLLAHCRALRAALQRVVEDESPPWQYDELRAVLAAAQDEGA